MAQPCLCPRTVALGRESVRCPDTWRQPRNGHQRWLCPVSTLPSEASRASAGKSWPGLQGESRVFNGQGVRGPDRHLRLSPVGPCAGHHVPGQVGTAKQGRWRRGPWANLHLSPHSQSEVSHLDHKAVKLLSHVRLLAISMDCNPPGSYPWDSPGKNTGVDCHFLLQGIFLTQESNSHLLPCRQILSCPSHVKLK